MSTLPDSGRQLALVPGIHCSHTCQYQDQAVRASALPPIALIINGRAEAVRDVPDIQWERVEARDPSILKAAHSWVARRLREARRVVGHTAGRSTVLGGSSVGSQTATLYAS